MSVVKNISGGPLDVPFLDRTVEDGETVTVPDEHGDGVELVWPDNRWEKVKQRVSPEKKAKPGEDE